MITRYNIINFLISKLNCTRYLEIGTRDGECFEKISCKHKECVDIEYKYSGLTHLCSSDEFFEYNKRKYDVIFIDGNHEEEFVDKDIINSLKVLDVGGVIVMHDCRPLNKDDLTPPGRYNGTVYKSFIKARHCLSGIATCVVNEDEGCGVIIKVSNDINCFNNKLPEEYYNFDTYLQNKHQILNLIECSKLDEWVNQNKVK